MSLQSQSPPQCSDETGHFWAAAAAAAAAAASTQHAAIGRHHADADFKCTRLQSADRTPPFHKHLHHGRHFQQLVVPARALRQRKGEATTRRNRSARARASSCDASVHQVGWSREDWMSRLKTSTTVYVDNMSFYTAEEQVHFFFSQVAFDPYYPKPY